MLTDRARRAASSLRLLLALAAIALAADVLATACHRAPPATHAARDAATAHDAGAVLATGAGDGATGVEFGPANPWGDGAVPTSTATGPEADTTRATLNAVRATVGFWRIAHRAATACPTLADLAGTAGTGFDRATMERDAWGSPIDIECQGAEVRLRSRGPDRLPDTPDDILAR